MDYIRTLISGNKKRFIDRKYNLDLSYITPRIIAMAFPGSGIQILIRNNINEVKKFLDDRHGDNYLVFNLTQEVYDYSKFKNNVVTYKLLDSYAPSLPTIFQIVEQMHTHLKKNSNNVVVIHCRAGKGRAGLIICCYLLFTGLFNNCGDVFNYYSAKRFEKGEGITQPSQKKYIEYFLELLKGTKNYFPYKRQIKSIHIKNFDKGNVNGKYITPFCDFCLKNSEDVTYSTKVFNYFNQSAFLVKDNEVQVVENDFFFEIQGDVTIKISLNEYFYIKNMGRVSFNTAFIEPNTEKIIFQAKDIYPENLLKKKKVPKNYQIIIILAKINEDKLENSENQEVIESFFKNEDKEESEIINRVIKEHKRLKEPGEGTKKEVKTLLFGNLDSNDIDYILNKTNEEKEISIINNKLGKNKKDYLTKSNNKFNNIVDNDNTEENNNDGDNEDELEQNEEQLNEDSGNNFSNSSNSSNDSFENECNIY